MRPVAAPTLTQLRIAAHRPRWAHVKRARSACYAPRDRAGKIVLEIVMPGQPLRLPGSPANLQVALDAIWLIERNDIHANILGATVREIKILRWSAPFCRELLRTSYLDTFRFSRN